MCKKILLFRYNCNRPIASRQNGYWGLQSDNCRWAKVTANKGYKMVKGRSLPLCPLFCCEVFSMPIIFRVGSIDGTSLRWTGRSDILRFSSLQWLLQFMDIFIFLSTFCPFSYFVTFFVKYAKTKTKQILSFSRRFKTFFYKSLNNSAIFFSLMLVVSFLKFFLNWIFFKSGNNYYEVLLITKINIYYAFT